mmetsp:Transcript_20252/g.46896  ORF Transcript_20252/g.46896 Transcript_20252/m.46896 type:complete len:225 (+) Transcript_20252:443-1117(+)
MFIQQHKVGKPTKEAKRFHHSHLLYFFNLHVTQIQPPNQSIMAIKRHLHVPVFPIFFNTFRRERWIYHISSCIVHPCRIRFQSPKGLAGIVKALGFFTFCSFLIVIFSFGPTDKGKKQVINRLVKTRQRRRGKIPFLDPFRTTIQFGTIHLGFEVIQTLLFRIYKYIRFSIVSFGHAECLDSIANHFRRGGTHVSQCLGQLLDGFGVLIGWIGRGLIPDGHLGS